MRASVFLALWPVVLTSCSPPSAPSNDSSLRDEGSILLDDLRSKVIPAEGHDPRTMCQIDEEAFVAVEAALLHPLREAFLARDTKGLDGLLAADVHLEGWGTPGAPERVVSGIEEAHWVSAPGVDGPAARAALAGWLGAWRQVEDVKLDTVKVDAPGRDYGVDFQSARLTIQLDVRGIDAQGWRRQDRGTLTVDVRRADGTWRVFAMSAGTIESLRAERPLFRDATDALGADALPVWPRIEAIRRGGYAVALGDYNRDGHTDMYVGGWGAGSLMAGTADGAFRPADAGLGEDTLVKTALFVDLDNDGWDDLFLVRFTAEGKGEQDLVVYHNDQGRFVRAASPFTGRVPAGYAMPATAADFNGDGALDVYVGYPGARDFTVLGDRPQDLAVQGLLVNDGAGGFRDQTEVSFVGDRPTNLYAHSTLAVDFDDDQDMDIVVIDDRGGLSPMYRNDGAGVFSTVAEDVGAANRGWGMGTAAGDFDGDGHTDLIMTNVDFVAGHRYVNSCTSNWSGKGTPRPQTGARAFRGLGGGQFEEVTEAVGLGWVGEAAAGAELVDYDNDGDLDLYVANGLWSGTNPRQDLSSLFIRTYVDGVDWGDMVKLLTWQGEKDAEYLQGTLKAGDRPEARHWESQSGFMRILSLYRGDLTNPDASDDTRPSMAGFQRNRLFRNDGGVFTEIGWLAGADSVADGYVIARADLDRDGRVDLVLRNADPGSTDVHFPPVQVLMNEAAAGNSLVLRLEGTESSRNAIGAEVTARVGTRTSHFQLLANNGTAQSDRFVHVGLGSADHADRLEIRWPSGRVQVVEGLTAGSHTIVEE